MNNLYLPGYNSRTLIHDCAAMTSLPSHTFTSFDGFKRIAHGDLKTNAVAVKRALESGSSGPAWVFSDRTGCIVEIDVRGSEAEAIARLPKEGEINDGEKSESVEADQLSLPPRGRGRPRLGVIAREITLLPRHWDWLSEQPGGASVALRKLVEEAKRSTAGREDKRQRQERAYNFMSAMAGNMVDFEESTRALFAADAPRFAQLTAAWPEDVRDYAISLAGYDKA